MTSTNYAELVNEACKDHGPIVRCRLRIVEGQIEVEVSAGSIALTLERLSPFDNEKAWAELTKAFEDKGVIVAKSDAAWDEILGMEEIAPGVLIGDDEIHIVDDIGEVVMWDYEELMEEGTAMTAIRVACISAIEGPAAVRAHKNLISRVSDVE